MEICNTKFHGAPENVSERIPQEQNCYAVLERLGIPFDRVDHEALDTIEDCKAAEAVLGTKICKNLFLCNRQKTVFHLLLMPGDKRFVTKNFSKALGVSRCSFASPEHMKNFLGLTPGSVTVLGLMNDPDCSVNLVIDKDLLNDTYVGCHPMINTSTLKLKVDDILNVFLPDTGHKPTFIELSEEQ